MEFKVGGNVAGYICTPGGHVIDVILGPVSADELLREADWAVQVYARMKKKDPRQWAQYVAWKHATLAPRRKVVDPTNSFNWTGWGDPDAAWLEMRDDVHALLARYPLVELSQVYRTVFRNILGEPLNRAAVGGPPCAECKVAERPQPAADVTHRDTARRLATFRSEPAPPAAARDKPPRAESSDPDKLAERQLRLAQGLLDANPDAAKRRLSDILANFPGTDAAREAADALRSLD